jgi:general secretion pathway protein D
MKSKPSGALHRVLLGALLMCALLLSSCAQQLIREEADTSLREGKYEKAVEGLSAGLKRYPESPVLRSGLLQAQNEALTRLLVQAAGERAAGRLDEAEATLKRARPFDTGGKRVNALLAELDIDRRQRESLSQAEELYRAKKPDAALRLLAVALKDNPRQPDLLALQRRLEGEQRRAQLRDSAGALAETRPITLDFRDANLRTVLDVVTRNSGINFILDKDVRQDLRVTTFLRQVKVEDAIDLIVSTHQLAKKVVDPQTVLIYPNTPDKQREHQEQVVRVFYLASAEAKGAAAFLRAMLRLRDPYVDERANMLAIRESAPTVELAERLIALYDSNEPEVLLELEVIEVRTSRLTDLGVKFPDTVGLTPLAPSGATGLTWSNIQGLTANRIGLSVAGLLLTLKREVGDLNTLANPRIRARNREKAKVLIGDKVPIITATTGQGGFVADSVSYIDVGLKLEVEPTVYADDEVAIRVNLEVSSLAREVRTNSGSLAYQIGTRTAATTLRLRDGETQLLAGLISNDERSSASRVPGLGDLPLAGRLFSSQRDESQRTELVLAITPRVLRNVRQADASETELWVGTEMSTRLRPVGGQAPRAEPPAAATTRPGTAAQQTAPAGSAQPAPAGATPAPQSPMSPLPPLGAPAIDSAPGAAPAPPSMGAPLMPAAPQATLSLRWQGPAELAVGETGVATLELSSTVALRGGPVSLRYPADRIQLLAVEEGSFFNQAGAATSFSQAVDAQAGMVRAGILRNQATGAQGQGTLVRVRFKALKAGPAELAVVSLEPVSLGDPLPPTALPMPLRINVKP